MYQQQLSFSEAVSRAFSKYCDFSGRASRSEYWWFELFQIIVNALVSWLLIFANIGEYGTYAVTGFVGLVFFLPGLGLAVRRLHDLGKGGGWIFINFIPLIGNLIYLVWMCTASEYSDNRFGPVPNVVEGGAWK